MFLLFWCLQHEKCWPFSPASPLYFVYSGWFQLQAGNRPWPWDTGVLLQTTADTGLQNPFVKTMFSAFWSLNYRYESMMKLRCEGVSPFLPGDLQLCSLKRSGWCTHAWECPCFAFSLGNSGQEVLQRKDNYFPPPLCFSSQKSGLNWKPVKQICLISSVKLSWSAPRCAVENWGKPEEGFVKMKKTRATKCTCVYVCVCAHRTKEKGELWSC